MELQLSSASALDQDWEFELDVLICYTGASLIAQWLKKKKKIHLQCRSCRRLWFHPWVRKIPWRRK